MKKNKKKLPRELEAWISQLIDSKSEVRREEIKNIRLDRRSFPHAPLHSFRVIFEDGKICGAFTANERQAIILTQAERITSETDPPRNFLEVRHVCMTSWL